MYIFRSTIKILNIKTLQAFMTLSLQEQLFKCLINCPTCININNTFSLFAFILQSPCNNCFLIHVVLRL